MDNPDSRHRRRHEVWTRYWATGQLHSCAGSFEGNYDGALAGFWAAVLDGLQPAGRLLDVASGNGPIPRLLVDRHADAAGRSCEAVDLADVAPAWLDAVPAPWSGRVRFHGGVAAEALPFPEAAFDVVTSQFGIEYSELERSLPEAVRVLRAGGRIAAVLHHAGSVSCRLAAAEVAHISWLLAPGGLLDGALQMAEPLARAATPQGRASLMHDAAANAVRDRFNTLQDEIDRQVATSACPDVLHETREAVATVLRDCGRTPLHEIAARLAGLRRGLEDGSLRLRELLDCALDEAAIGRLLQRLDALGVTAQAAPLVDQGRLLGWALTGTKRLP